ARRQATRSTRPGRAGRTGPRPDPPTARSAQARSCAAIRSRPGPPGPAARTTGRSPPAHPLDGASVRPHPQLLGHLLGDLGPEPGVGADELHDLRAQLDRATTAAPLVDQPRHPRLIERRVSRIFFLLIKSGIRAVG